MPAGFVGAVALEGEDLVESFLHGQFVFVGVVAVDDCLEEF